MEMVVVKKTPSNQEYTLSSEVGLKEAIAFKVCFFYIKAVWAKLTLLKYVFRRS